MRTTAVSLRDLVVVKGGGTPRRSVSKYYGGEVPWVTPKDMKKSVITESEVTLTKDGVDNSPAKLIPAGSVLVVVRSGVLKHTLPVALTARPVTINQDMKALIPCDIVDASYLSRLIKASQPKVLSWVRATTADNFPIDSLLDLEFRLPALEDQRRIAEILDQADAIRAKRRQILNHLGTLTQSIFRDMFGDCTEVVNFGEIISKGPTNGLYRPQSDYGTGTPILRIDGFDSGEIKSAPWKRVRIPESDRERYSLAVGDLVINRVNALSHLGKSTLIDHLNEPSVYESNMMRIRLDLERVVPRFVAVWLQSATAKIQILSKAKKAINQASINQRDVRSLLVPLPPRHVQATFAQRAERVDAQRAVVRRALDVDNKLFESLQARAFRGEL